MPNAIRPPPNPVFVIRLWQEPTDQEPGNEEVDTGLERAANPRSSSGAKPWRGKIKCIATGEVRYFSSWENLTALIPLMLANDDRLPPDSP